MNFLFDNFQILIVVGLVIATLLKKRSELKEQEEAERQAREEMIRGLKEVKRPPAATKSTPQQGTSRRQGSTPPPPPPLVWNDEPAPAKSNDPWPMPAANAYEAPAPTGNEQQQKILERQRSMQERLAEIKREAERVKQAVGGARATQRKVSHNGQTEDVLMPIGSLRHALKNPRQVRRAVVLREILGPPISLK